MFFLVDNTYLSNNQLQLLLDKLKNPYNDEDNLFSVKNVDVGNYTLATNGTIYDTHSNLKMVCKYKGKTENIERLYNELAVYTNFSDNIDAIKGLINKRGDNDSFCIAAINSRGDYIVINDKSGMDQVYIGTSGITNKIYSTYHINTYFKGCIEVTSVVPISKGDTIVCIDGTITTIKDSDNSKEISIAGQMGKGVMSGDIMNDGMDSIFGPLTGNSNSMDRLSNIEYDMRPNKNGVSIFDKIVQWSKVQIFVGTGIINSPTSTNVFYDKNFFNHNANKNYDTSTSIIVEEWIDKGLEMKSRGINPCILNMTDKVFPAVDIHLGNGGQEECIFRRSNLNNALVLDKFYPFSNDNRVIYSKDVTIYYGGENVKWEPLKEPQKISIISCPPVKSPYNLEYDYTKLFENAKMCASHIATTKGYLENTLQAAIKNGHDGIVLPAFGCEGQKNPPRCVANILKELIEKYKGYIKEVVVCIPDADERLLGNYNIFKEVLERKTIVCENSTEVVLDNILDEMN